MSTSDAILLLSVDTVYHHISKSMKELSGLLIQNELLKEREFDMSKDIKRYLGYTFASSWILWSIIIIANHFNQLQAWTPLFILFFIGGGVMPPICAILIKKKYSTNEDYKLFIKSIINPKHHFGWYILVIALAFTLLLLPTLIGAGSLEHPLYIAIFAFPQMIFGGGLEEVGWRGFLLPTLKKKFSLLTSTMILNIIWASWHIPLWFISGTSEASSNFLYFFIETLSMSLLLSAIYNATESILLCIMFHASSNSFYEIFVINHNLKSLCLILLFSIVIFIVIGKRTESRVKKFSHYGNLQ